MRPTWSVVSESRLDLTCGLQGPKTDFWPFSLYWQTVNIMPNEQGDCWLACRPRFIYGLGYHPYICHVPAKISSLKLSHPVPLSPPFFLKMPKNVHLCSNFVLVFLVNPDSQQKPVYHQHLFKLFYLNKNFFCQSQVI